MTLTVNLQSITYGAVVDADVFTQTVELRGIDTATNDPVYTSYSEATTDDAETVIFNAAADADWDIS